MDSMTARSRDLRKNATEEERILWYQFLRTQTPRWRRQAVVGRYILDFYCRTKKLAIELDGSQHFEPEAQAYDARRTAYLNANGIRVLRFTNTDIHKNLRGVAEAIQQAVLSCEAPK